MNGSADPHHEPCGPDCAYAARLPGDLDGAWFWCVHPARRAIVRDGAECVRFRPRGEPGVSPTNGRIGEHRGPE